ncbi:M48 family metallopeptidase [Trinickia fusca]|nr:M48 family metallopeptidase [Trinickia fusca]
MLAAASAVSLAPPRAGAGEMPASAVAAGAAASAPPYEASEQIRFGNGTRFRNSMPSPLVEARSLADYGQLLEHAQQSGQLLPPSDPRVQRIRELVTRIAPFADKWNDRVKTWKWEVNVVRSRDTRLYVLPGGKVVVYGGLLDRARLKPDELGMLFGHEIAHALREQARERLVAQQSAPLGGQAMSQLFGVGELGTAATAGGDTSVFGVHVQYDATDETEADVIGSDIAARAGFDPRAAVTLWDKLAAASRGEKAGSFVALHPYSAARRRDLVKRLPDMLALFAKAKGVAVEQLPSYAGIKVPTRRTNHN